MRYFEIQALLIYSGTCRREKATVSHLLVWPVFLIYCLCCDLLTNMPVSHSDKVPNYWMFTNSDTERNWRQAVAEIVSWHLLGATEENKKKRVQILGIPAEIRTGAYRIQISGSTASGDLTGSLCLLTVLDVVITRINYEQIPFFFLIVLLSYAYAWIIK